MPVDPLTAIGLAGNIVQFIDFGTKIVSKAHDIHTSATGATRDVSDLNHVTEELRRTSQVLRNGLASVGGDDSNLEILCRACIETAQKLIVVLRELTANESPSKWKSVRQALKSVWKKEEIESMRQSLAGYRAQLTLHVVVDLRRDVSKLNLEQSKRFQTLDETAQQSAKDIVDALADQDDFFEACLLIQSDWMKEQHDEMMHMQAKEHAETRDCVTQSHEDAKTHISTTVLSANTHLQQVVCEQDAITRTTLEQATLTEGARVKDAVVQNGDENRGLVLEGIQAESEEIQAVVKQHVEIAIAKIQEDMQKNQQEMLEVIRSLQNCIDSKRKKTLTERGAALTAAYIALQTIYDGLVSFLHTIMTQALHLADNPSLQRLCNAYFVSNASKASGIDRSQIKLDHSSTVERVASQYLIRRRYATLSYHLDVLKYVFRTSEVMDGPQIIQVLYAETRQLKDASAAFIKFGCDGLAVQIYSEDRKHCERLWRILLVASIVAKHTISIQACRQVMQIVLSTPATTNEVSESDVLLWIGCSAITCWARVLLPPMRPVHDSHSGRAEFIEGLYRVSKCLHNSPRNGYYCFANLESDSLCRCVIADHVTVDRIKWQTQELQEISGDVLVADAPLRYNKLLYNFALENIIALGNPHVNPDIELEDNIPPNAELWDSKL